MSVPEATLRVQINQIDYVLAQPGPFDNSALSKVPVIRIFGPSSIGQQACVHVHQVYPYFFMEYEGKMNPESGEPSSDSIARGSVSYANPRRSESLRLQTVALFEPRNRCISEAKSSFADLSIRSVHHIG